MAKEVSEVLVIGATGLQGRAVCKRLLDSGIRVAGLSRNTRSKASLALANSGVEMIPGDLGNPADLKSAMKQKNGVFAVFDPMSNGAKAEHAHGIAAIDAALSCGVAHFIYSSVASPDADTGVSHFKSKLLIEEYLKESTIDWTILRPTSFMEALTENKFVPPILWHVWSKVSGWDAPLQWVAVDDIARAAAAVFREPASSTENTYTLVGDECSLAEAKRSFREIRGKNPVRIPMPVWLFRKVVGEDLYNLFRWYRKDGFEGDREELRSLVGDPLDMRRWLESSS